MQQIDKDIRKIIIDKIILSVDNYISHNISINHLKKYFSENGSFNIFLNDINHIGEEQFDTKDEYKIYIKKTLFDILKDRDAYNKDKKKFKNVKTFENFIEKNI